MDDKLKFAKKRSSRAMKKLTGEFGDSSKTKVVVPEDIVEASVKKAKANASEAVETGSKFFSKLLHDKRTYIIAGSLAAVAGIAAYALNRERNEQTNPNITKIGRTTIYYG